MSNNAGSWTETEDGCIFHDSFDGDIRAIANDLRQIDGLRDFIINPGLSICDNIKLNVFNVHHQPTFILTTG
uniref:Bm215 n=1 Tax=Brugia malayi TaxID=6279 RepID=A0A1I9GCU3_BRUMA|nr:Bm215 [Brugia malayi]